MKTLEKFYLLLFGLLLITNVKLSIAQQVNMDQIRQDINILESVLEEMFDVKDEDSVINFYSSDDGVSGTYVPGYGAIFQIDATGYPLVVYLKQQAEGTSQSINTGKEFEFTKKEVIGKIVTFLGEYGPTLSNLHNSENILVSFKSPNESTFEIYFLGSKKKKISQEALPFISVIAEMSEIQAYQEGNISKQAFRERLLISIQKNSKDENKDLDILAQILETAFEDQKEQFQINSDISYQLINNFGALYSFEISYGNAFGFGIISDDLAYAYSTALTSLSLDSLDVGFDVKFYGNLFEGDSAIVSIDSAYIAELDEKMKAIKGELQDLKQQLKERQEEIKQERRQKRTDVRQSLDQFLKELKKYIVQYGGTLHSLSPEQYLLFSIRLNSNMSDIPDRIVLQVKKAVLMNENISRQEAMEEIEVRKIK